MPERTSYAPGTPCWVDIGVPDIPQAVEFYRGVFGWEFVPYDDPEAQGYGDLRLGGRAVAGMGPQQSPDVPPYWTVYVSVRSAEVTMEHVIESGGTSVVGAMEIFDQGVMAVAQDINGAFISVWEPKAYQGCELVNETGAFGWCELATTDIASTRGFYSNVFGWELDPARRDTDTALFTVGGNVVSGAHTAGDGEYPGWSVWFGIDDCDASATEVTGLGGSVLVAPNDMGFGRGAVVADPWGAVFGIAEVRAELIDGAEST